MARVCVGDAALAFVFSPCSTLFTCRLGRALPARPTLGPPRRSARVAASSSRRRGRTATSSLGGGGLGRSEEVRVKDGIVLCVCVGGGGHKKAGVARGAEKGGGRAPSRGECGQESERGGVDGSLFILSTAVPSRHPPPPFLVSCILFLCLPVRAKKRNTKVRGGGQKGGGASEGGGGCRPPRTQRPPP